MTILQMQVDHNVKREIRNMLLVNGHPFIITLLDVLLTDQHLVLVLEKAGGGELFSLVASKKQLSEEEARFYLQQIVLGVEHLHREGIYHRDLKLVRQHRYHSDSPGSHHCPLSRRTYSWRTAQINAAVGLQILDTPNLSKTQCRTALSGLLRILPQRSLPGESTTGERWMSGQWG